MFRIIDELVDCDRYFLSVKYLFDSIIVVVSHEDSPSYPGVLNLLRVSCPPIVYLVKWLTEYVRNDGMSLWRLGYNSHLASLSFAHISFSFFRSLSLVKPAALSLRDTQLAL